MAVYETNNVGGMTEAPVAICRWPGGAPFALFLSHDVDQIHDREMFRMLADLNHVRRMVTQNEPGHCGKALRRLARAMFQPKPAVQDFETILDIENRHDFKSTFFLLHDRYWARYGARYSLRCKAMQNIAKLILEAGGELGVHGGYYRFNDASLYRESMDAIERNFGVRPCGIRNHLLRFSQPETWQAQAAAGFAYDATFGLPCLLGPRDGKMTPFWAQDSAGRNLDLLELPLTVMDVTLFCYHRLQSEAAVDKAWQVIQEVICKNGLVSLLWHNNYFNEPEYQDWQMAYEELLGRFAALKPWCGTGTEINDWWRALASVSVRQLTSNNRQAWFQVSTQKSIRNLAFRINKSFKVLVQHPAATISIDKAGWLIVIPVLQPKELFTISVEHG